MQTATRRTLIAAAALGAAGLFGSLPYHGLTQAQGIPTVHHDVALVDLGDTLLGSETGFDTTLYDGVLGPNGSEEMMYNSFVTAFGTTEANYLLDTNTASPVFSGVFNGAESRFFEGAFLDVLSGEDHINQLFGVSATESQTAILEIFTSTGGPPIPEAAGVTLADLTGAVGSSAFDTDLSAIANADFASGFTDLQGYFADLLSGAGALGDGLGDGGGFLATILSDLGLGGL
ncbi:hypothetical protein [Mycobacterium sp.]|uniref:hypothetical protein n=1 Tax=Mycobacterium sp. TaxID=1785 RepID=UPI003BAF7398